MKRRTPLAAILISLAALTAAHATSTTHGKSSTPASPAKTEVATFAMGCFWCGETQFESQPGVLSVISGYTGGREEHPSYEQVSEGGTGHYESVQVTFDPSRTSYAKLLDLFWHGIDPTQDDGQFCDRGSQYRSVVFVADDKQRKLAEDSLHAIEASGVLHAPIVTQILPATRFWPAEDYHQDFWKKDPVRYRTYRLGCGRDRRLVELWGALASKPLVH
jgi:peptide-methionine (S)-S-oxide reductase